MSSNPEVRLAWKTSVGWVRAYGSNGRIERLILGVGGRATAAANRRAPWSGFRRELDRYLSGGLTRFSARTRIPPGSAFERKVWKVLTRIPYGETRTYGWVAGQIGRPRAHRAVGRACGRNPLPIMIPCHRVIRTTGEPGGYSGGIAIKQRLLEIERRDGKKRSAAASHADAVAIPGDRTSAANR